MKYRIAILTERHFKTPAEYSAATKQGIHSITLDHDVFQNVSVLNARDMTKIRNLYDAKDFDFPLKPGSAVIDKAAVIPNVTDGYTGAATDLGALEYGKPAPHYGPRA